MSGRPNPEDDLIDGDGPNRNPIEGGEDPVQPRPVAGSSQDAGSGEGRDQQKAASKGINPVQHSE